MLVVQSIFDDASVLEFMSDDTSEAEEMRAHLAEFDFVVEVRVLDEPGWRQSLK
jgi:hypothetical protein